MFICTYFVRMLGLLQTSTRSGTLHYRCDGDNRTIRDIISAS
jgi:hypothetical protein